METTPQPEALTENIPYRCRSLRLGPSAQETDLCRVDVPGLDFTSRLSLYVLVCRGNRKSLHALFQPSFVHRHKVR